MTSPHKCNFICIKSISNVHVQTQASLTSALQGSPDVYPYLHKPCWNVVKFAYEPSGPSGWSLSQFLQHEATWSISTLPQMRCQSLSWLPPASNCSYPFICLSGETHCESEVSCQRTQHSVPGQGSNPDLLIQRRACKYSY